MSLENTLHTPSINWQHTMYTGEKPSTCIRCMQSFPWPMSAKGLAKTHLPARPPDPKSPLMDTRQCRHVYSAAPTCGRTFVGDSRVLKDYEATCAAVAAAAIYLGWATVDMGTAEWVVLVSLLSWLCMLHGDYDSEMIFSRIRVLKALNSKFGTVQVFLCEKALNAQDLAICGGRNVILREIASACCWASSARVCGGMRAGRKTKVRCEIC